MEGLPTSWTMGDGMTHEEVEALPARPESVAEWEDLLLRLEIVPRVVRNTVDEVVNATAAHRVLAAATEREARVGRWLEVASRIVEPGRRAQEEGDGAGDAAAASLRFASLRARTFAMVQRRGLEVWDWRGPLNGGPSVTVHQLLCWLAGRDAHLLADLRAATASEQGEC